MRKIGMKYLLVKNANAVFESCIRRCDILICDNLICDVDFSGELPENCEVYDARGAYVSPGFIDIHLHGGGGFDFMDCTAEALKSISEVHLKNGTTTMIPTSVSSDFDDIMRLCDVYRQCVEYCPNFYGIHLEGPYLSVAMKGAHREKYLHSPTDEEISLLLERGRGVIKRITAAPELDNMDFFARKMTEGNVHLSIGHSDATSEVALNAFDNGFSHVTHLYNVTPSVRKVGQQVKAGIVEAAYLNDNVTVEIIADGKHVAADAFKLAVKIKGPDKVCMISDALRPAGTDAKESYLGEKTPENLVIIEDEVAKLPDRTRFAGSVATSEMLLRRGVEFFGFSLCDTVRMMTTTPASIMGMTDRGKLKCGLLADICVFGENLKLRNVIKNGKII